jgi:hypothetical protein
LEGVYGDLDLELKEMDEVGKVINVLSLAGLGEFEEDSSRSHNKMNEKVD